MSRPKKITEEELADIKQDTIEFKKTEEIFKSDIEELTEQIEESVVEEIEDTNPIEYTSYGSTLFDLISGGGAAWGKIGNIIGPESSSKSLLCSEFIAAAYKQYGKDLVWVYDDAEAGYSFDSRRIWGIDIIKDTDIPSETLEQFEINITRKLEKLKDNQRLIYVLDSFDSLTTSEEIEYNDKHMKAIEDEKKIAGTYGQSKAKGTSKFFRIMRNKIKDKKCILLIVSQVRENIGGGMYAQKYTRAGGKALDFYSAQIFWLSVAEKLELAGNISGITVKIRNTKNKVGVPFREGFVNVIFNYAVDNVTTNINYVYDLKTDGGKNIGGYATKKLLWEGKEYSVRALVKYIEENNLENLLAEKVIAKWHLAESKSDASVGRKAKF